MKNISKYITANRLNIFLFLFTFSLSLTVNFNPPIWINYADPYDYLHQSKISLFDKQFYFPEKIQDFYPRPFTVPLFYKIANSNPKTIIILQKFMHYLSALLMGFVLLGFLKKSKLKIIFIIFWYLYMSWWNIAGWANTLLSESLSNSFMFIWLASFLYYLRTKKILFLFVHIIVAILFSFTRDTWPYILIIFYSLFLLYSLFWNKKMRISFLMFFVTSIFVFFIQQNSANTGHRYRLPIFNNIAFRIIPNDEYLKWFKEKGMPDAEKLKSENLKLENFKKIYPLYEDTAYLELFNWIDKHGKKIYTEFLLTHPFKTLLFYEKPEDLKKIFSYNLYYYGPRKNISNISYYIFPLFNLISIIVLFILFLIESIKQKNYKWVFPLIIIIVFTINAIILYNADSLEIERHLISTNIIMQFIGIYLIFNIFDNLQKK